MVKCTDTDEILTLMFTRTFWMYKLEYRVANEPSDMDVQKTSGTKSIRKQKDRYALEPFHSRDESPLLSSENSQGIELLNYQSLPFLRASTFREIR